MIKSASTIIIGGGIIGCAIAYHLGELEESGVILLEQSTLASGASSRANNIIERQFVDEFDVLLRVRSFEILNHFFDDYGVIFRRIGFARLTGRDDDLAKYRQSAATQQALGVRGTRVVQPDELKEMFPFLNLEGIVGSLYSPSDGMSDGTQLTLSMAAGARERGIEINQDTRVLRIDKNGSSGFTVVTDRGEISCKNIVNAAGARSGRIAEMVGLDLPFRATRNQTTLLWLPLEGAGMLTVCVDELSKFYIHGAGYGQTVFSGFTNIIGERATADPDEYDQRLDPSYTKGLEEKINSRAPGLLGYRVKGGWTCIMGEIPDGRPIVGRHPDLPRFVNCVVGDQGIQLSAILGKLVAEILVDGRSKTVPDLRKLAVERFR